MQHSEDIPLFPFLRISNLTKYQVQSNYDLNNLLVEKVLDLFLSINRLLQVGSQLMGMLNGGKMVMLGRYHLRLQPGLCLHCGAAFTALFASLVALTHQDSVSTLF